MAGATIRVEGVLAEFPMSILPNITREPTREALINLHIIIITNTASVALSLGGGCHIHLVLKMVTEDYLYQTGHAVMLQLEHLTAAIGEMKTQLKTLLATTTTTKRRYYCWSYGSNFSYESKNFPTT